MNKDASSSANWLLRYGFI